MVQYLAKDILKQLKKAHFKEVRVAEDHHQFKNEQGILVTVPYKRLKDNIALGTAKQILKQIKKGH